MIQVPRILIVEDDTLIAAEIGDRLCDLGYKVCAKTRTAEDGVILAEGLAPDLVLMDIRLRGAMDGVDAAARIRNEFDIPVVYLTAYADDTTLARAKVTEPFGYIIKPFDERELLSAVEMALYKHRIEKQLRESEQRLAATLRSIGDGVIATDTQGQVVLANPVAEDLLSVSQGGAVGQAADELLRLEDAETGEPVPCPVDAVLADGDTRYLAGHLLQSQDGREIAIDGSATGMRGDQGQIQGVVVVFRDVTRRLEEQAQREALQEQLYEAQKMEAVAALTGRLAHAFNEHLTAILGSASLILAERPAADDDPVRTAAERIRQAGRRSATLTRQILALSGEQATGQQVVGFYELVAGTEEKLGDLTDGEVEVVHCFAPGNPYVKADPAGIEQVLLNLMLNAYEAMPAGGTITLTTELLRTDGEEAEPVPAGKGSPLYVCVRITDTGRGMDDKTLEHAFEPFFSTKPGAAGLGLSIAQNTVEQLGGWISVESQVERGSAFSVYLPAYEDPEAADIYRAPSLDTLRGNGEWVLLVEDDIEVRVAVGEMLRAGGYRVTEAGSVSAALNLFEADPEGYDLLMSDVMLPDRDGLYLADTCRAARPELPVLLASGLTDQRTYLLDIRARGYRFLPKPFGLMDLLPAVKEALAG